MEKEIDKSRFNMVIDSNKVEHNGHEKTIRYTVNAMLEKLSVEELKELFNIEITEEELTDEEYKEKCELAGFAVPRFRCWFKYTLHLKW